MQVLSKEQGVFELTLLNAELSRDQFDDFVVMGVSRGIPVEIMTRLQGLWNLTKEIAGEVVAIGKIVVRKIFEFLKANPNLSIGIALGAAVGALISGIPFIGPLLAPLSAGLSVLYGAAVGSTVDQGHPSSEPYIAASQLARKFFELIQSIFLSIKEYFAAP